MNNQRFLSDSTADSIREAAATLKAGHLVAFPTETVYGLGADARNPDAVKRIYEVKGRPTHHPLIVHLSSINELSKWGADIPDYAISLAEAFWPGPMTLIVRRSNIVGDFITGGQETVGLRVPSHPLALALIQEFKEMADSAIAAPSANRFGQVSPTSSSDVCEELSQYLSDSDLVLDGGNSVIGIESTIIDCTRRLPQILRQGFITIDDAESLAGVFFDPQILPNQIKHSGSFEKHYAPKCKVILSDIQLDGAGFLALKKFETPKGMKRLSAPETIVEFAQVLYSTLRSADREGLKEIVVLPPPSEGVGAAILERLKKASQGR